MGWCSSSCPWWCQFFRLASFWTRKNRPVCLWARRGGFFLSWCEAPVLMVENDAAGVDRDLSAGRVACPACEGVLRPWGWARRRLLRRRDGSAWLRPRRGRCRPCGGMHVLLPVDTLVRRRDEVAVIGAALLAWLGGAGHRRIAVSLGLPADTVRGWLRRFAVRAEDVRAHFWQLAHRLDASLGAIEPRGSGWPTRWRRSASPPRRRCGGSGRRRRCGRSCPARRAGGCCATRTAPTCASTARSLSPGLDRLM